MEPLTDAELAEVRQLLGPQLEPLDEASLFEVARYAVRLLADLDAARAILATQAENREMLADALEAEDCTAMGLAIAARGLRGRLSNESREADVLHESARNLESRLAEVERERDAAIDTSTANKQELSAVMADRDALAKRVQELARLARRTHDMGYACSFISAACRCTCGSDDHNRAVDNLLAEVDVARLLGGGS